MPSAPGATGEDILAAVDLAIQGRTPIPGDDKTPVLLKSLVRGASEAFQRGASLDYIKRRIAVLIWDRRSLDGKQIAKLMGVDDAGFRRIRDEVAATQKEALRLSVDPEEFRHYS